MIRRAAVAVLALLAVACGGPQPRVHVAPLLERGAYLDACYATEGADAPRPKSDRRAEFRALRLALRRALRPSLYLEPREVRPEYVAFLIRFETRGQVSPEVTLKIGARYDGALWAMAGTGKVRSTVVGPLFGSDHGKLSAKEAALKQWPPGFDWLDGPSSACGFGNRKACQSRETLVRVAPTLGSDALLVSLHANLARSDWERKCAVDDIIELPLPAGRSLALAILALFAKGSVDLTEYARVPAAASKLGG